MSDTVSVKAAIKETVILADYRQRLESLLRSGSSSDLTLEGAQFLYDCCKVRLSSGIPLGVVQLAHESDAQRQLRFVLNELIDGCYITSEQAEWFYHSFIEKCEYCDSSDGCRNKAMVNFICRFGDVKSPCGVLWQLDGVFKQFSRKIFATPNWYRNLLEVAIHQKKVSAVK